MKRELAERMALEEVQQARYALESSLPAINAYIDTRLAGGRPSLEPARDRVTEAKRAMDRAQRLLDGGDE